MSRIALSMTFLVASTACSTALGLNDVTKGEGAGDELDRISALESKVEMLQASQDAILDALKPVAFRASLVVPQSVPSGGDHGTVVAFDKVDLDTHGAFDQAKFQYAVPVPGQYLVIAIVGYSGLDSGRANCEIWVDRPGSSKSETAVTTAGNSSGTGAALVRVTSAAAIQLDAGDRVYVKAFHDNGMPRNLLADSRSTNLQVIRIPILK